MTTLNAGAADGPRIVMHTSMGVIEIETYPDQAPVTVANFVEYVEAGYYDGLVFHRVIPGFVIQGGGFESGMQPRENRAAIDNEADNGLKNERGTLSMARTQDPHSATSQFFINLADNGMLDHTGKNPQGWGYAVFARVTDGMETVDAIAAVATGSRGPFRDVPVEDVVIERAEVVGAE